MIVWPEGTATPSKARGKTGSKCEYFAAGVFARGEYGKSTLIRVLAGLSELVGSNFVCRGDFRSDG